MPVYDSAYTEVLAPTIIEWSGWDLDGKRIATRLLSGDYSIETVGSKRRVGELTCLFEDTEALQRERLEDAAYEDGRFVLETRGGAWDVEVLDELESKRFKAGAAGRYREWYTVKLKLLRRGER